MPGRTYLSFFLDTSKALFTIGERYLIPKNADSFKLRLINTGFEMLSALTRLDGKKFAVTATDGRDLQPMEGDVLFLGVGETYDISIPISSAESSVFIRFYLPVDHFGQIADNFVHEPYLDVEFKRDENVPDGEFKTELFMRKLEDKILQNKHDNSAETPIWLNCPYPDKNVICKSISDFKRLESSDYKYEYEKSTNTPAKVSALDEPDVIFNINPSFRFKGSSLNGIKLKWPTAPFFNGTDTDDIVKCSDEQLAGAGGYCTQVRLLP